MHRYKNIAVTGRKQAGKSTLARWLLEQLGLPATGFQTLQYDMTDQGPLYELVELSSGQARPISRLTPQGIRGIPEAFEDFGTAVLAGSLASESPVVLLDEIGRFEKNSPGFLRGIASLLDSEKTVLAVLKQEELPHIQAIRQRPDTLVIDLDRCSRSDARAVLTAWMEKL